jgi:hypothetical protein
MKRRQSPKENRIYVESLGEIAKGLREKLSIGLSASGASGKTRRAASLLSELKELQKSGRGMM